MDSSNTKILGKIEDLEIESIHGGTEYSIDTLVVNNITDNLPTTQICSSQVQNFNNLPLADDTYGVPGEIHGLIGSSLYPYLMLPGQIKTTPDGPVALNTTLGYVILGNVRSCNASNYTTPSTFCGFIQTDTLEHLVTRFWEHEDIPTQGPMLSPSELKAETHFQETHFFDKDQQRYCVRLPFKDQPEILGSSSEIARSRFLALERKLEKNPALRVQYNDAISDLLVANQLEICKNDDNKGYFVSHHAILKVTKLTSKCRIVFDFSCPTQNGKSLNDILYSGPKLYNDLFNILLTLRLKKIALIADISKMFLQILLDSRDWHYQKIFRRFSPNDPIQVYYLNRATFGCTSSPFLSQRVIRQLASDYEHEFPLVKPVVFESFYMDDPSFG